MGSPKFSIEALRHFILDIKDPAKIKEELLKICLYDNEGLSIEANHLLMDGYRNGDDGKDTSR